MRRRRTLLLGFVVTGIAACATTTRESTLAELDDIDPDLDKVELVDTLESAEQNYRRYLEATPTGERAPEAMRRLADLQIEQAYGVVGAKASTAIATPKSATPLAPTPQRRTVTEPRQSAESDEEFERRASRREKLLSQPTEFSDDMLAYDGEPIPTGPHEAIDVYNKILEAFKHYEHSDKVLYQLSRAYDEIGQPDEAMRAMERLVTEYPHSKLLDEVHFRRGEYYFVRRRWRDAEQAYNRVVDMGPNSSFYELGRYKLGWTLYKQAFYEQALDNIIAILDYRKTTGYDFESYQEENDEHRVSDTFRVISLTVENLGGPEVLDKYFKERGQRNYSDKLYANLGAFYFEKRRYDDAASVYKSFVELNPYHRMSPHFGMRVIEIFEKAGFPQRIVEAKMEFSTLYALSSEYWAYNDVYASRDVIGYLKTNLADLADHYHALYQDSRLANQRPANFDEAQHWYRQLLTSFPADPETPLANYRLADLLRENQDFVEAATEYERTAYGYADHRRAADAGYAAIFSYRQELEVVRGARHRNVMKLAVASLLRFADTFPDYEQVPQVLVTTANELYAKRNFPLAIDLARKLIARYPHSNTSLLRSAWAIVAHSSIDIADYASAERAYMRVLTLTPADDQSRSAIVDGLAAAIYKLGERASLAEDYQAAADHFLRIKEIAPNSEIRAAAEYDAAAALIRLQEWTAAADVLEDFRAAHPEHELNEDATKQLAYLRHKRGEIELSAAEHERISADASDAELAREAMLTAGDLYDQAGALEEAVRVYEQYVQKYPQPLDINMDTRSRTAEIFRELHDFERYYDQLGSMVAVDRNAGENRDDRSRLLAANAALLLAEQTYERFARLKLVQPFEEGLVLKQSSMDQTIAALEALVSYEIAEVTAAATFYIAETFLNFSQSLIESERPAGLTTAEMNSYELAIEEESYPFEERAIEVHEANHELLLAGVYGPWVQESLEKLAVLMPGRYAKTEISEGLLRSIDIYAYRMPIASQFDTEESTPLGQMAAPEELGFTITEAAEINNAVRTRYGEAIVLLDLGEQQRGIKKLEDLAAEAPTLCATRIDLGIANHMAGNLDAALAHLLVAIELNVGHPVAQTELGIVYRKLGRFEDAKRSYETALAVYPGYHYARRNLAILCDLYLADLECALEASEAYMATVPGDDDVAIWIADIRNRMNR